MESSQSSVREPPNGAGSPSVSSTNPAECSSSPQPGLIIKSEGVRNVDSIHDSQPASLAVTVGAVQASDSATHAHLSTTTTTTVAQSTSCSTVSLAQENGNLGKRVRKSTSKFEEYEQSIKSPSAPAEPEKRTTNQLMFLKTSVLRVLWRHQFAWPFLKPVDPEALHLPDYFKIVKNPIDMSTIKWKLDSFAYTCAKECVDDFNLLFSNCYLYNLSLIHI